MTDWHAILGILSGVTSAGTLIPYLRDTLYGTTRPSIVSMTLWFVFTILTVFGQYSADGFTWTMVFGITVCFNNLIILTLCLSGYGYKGHSMLDFVSASLALFGMYLWWLTQDPFYGVLFAIAANACAGLPTYRKTYFHPKTESFGAWGMILLSTMLSVAAATKLTFESLAFPVFCFMEALLVLVLIQRKKSSMWKSWGV